MSHAPSAPRPPAPPEDPPRGIARAVLALSRVASRRPRRAIGLWVLLVVGCLVAGGLTGSRSLDEAESGVGDSGVAARQVADAGLRAPATEVVLVRTASAAATGRVARDLTAALRRTDGVAAAHGPVGDGPRAAALRTDGGRAVLVTATLRGDPGDAAERAPAVARTIAAVGRAHPGAELHGTGAGSLDAAIDRVVADDLRSAEVVSLPVTLLVLVIAFGALVAASVPLLLGVTAVAAAMGALGVVSQLVPTADTTGSLVVLIGLAVGVDYSLFYVRREREERRRGRGPLAALDAAAASVGRAVLVSGLTVMVALGGLLVTGIPIFASMAVGTIVVVAVALLGSLIVLPAVLALLGDRVERGRPPRALRPTRWVGALRSRRGLPPAAPRTPWRRLADVVTGRPVVSLVTAVALLVAVAAPALGLRTSEPGLGSLPADLPAVQDARAVERAFPGSPDDALLVVRGSDLGAARSAEALRALGARAARTTGGRGAVDVRVARDGRTAVVAVPMPDRGTDAARDVVRALRTDVAPTAEDVLPGATALVAGVAADELDFDETMAAKLPLVVGFVLGLALLLLLAAFRSVRLAVAVVALNLLSVAAAYGVMAAVFQHSWAEGALDFASTGTVASWLPLMSFVILFGLSMDYSVLVLERIREARAAGRGPREAAAEGVAATAGSITSAAAVMVAVFAIFGTLRMLEMKQMGVGLASAVLLDATIVRAIALPAVVTLLGEGGVRRPRPRRRPRAAAPAWDDARAPAVRRVPPAADVR